MGKVKNVLFLEQGVFRRGRTQTAPSPTCSSADRRSECKRGMSVSELRNGGSVYQRKCGNKLVQPQTKSAPLPLKNGLDDMLALQKISIPRSDSFRFRGAVYPAVKPYSVQVSVTTGYTNADLLKPFYFGGLVGGQMAFPSYNFPSKYYYQDEPLPSPLVESLVAMIPFGFSMRPFDGNIEFFAEIDLGATIYTFYFPEHGFIGKVFPAFTAETCIGAAWNGISLFAGGGYDTKLGFIFSAGMGLRVEVPQ